MAANNKTRFSIDKGDEKLKAKNPGSTPLIFTDERNHMKYSDLAKKYEDSSALLKTDSYNS